jgi:hypothetical protein
LDTSERSCWWCLLENNVHLSMNELNTKTPYKILPIPGLTIKYIGVGGIEKRVQKLFASKDRACGVSFLIEDEL